MPRRPRPPVLRRLPPRIPADSCAAQHSVQSTRIFLAVFFWLLTIGCISLILWHVSLPHADSCAAQHFVQSTSIFLAVFFWLLSRYFSSFVTCISPSADSCQFMPLKTLCTKYSHLFSGIFWFLNIYTYFSNIVKLISPPANFCRFLPAHVPHNTLYKALTCARLRSSY